MAISCLLMGVTLLSNFNTNVLIVLILALSVVQYIMKGPYYTLIKQYFNNINNGN